MIKSMKEEKRRKIVASYSLFFCSCKVKGNLIVDNGIDRVEPSNKYLILTYLCGMRSQ